MKKLKIAVLMGGPSAEYDVSLKTGKMVSRYLNRKKYSVKSVLIGRDGKWPISPSRLKCDVAFIAMHGAYGEDGKIQAVLDSYGIPYTGSGAPASALAMNKERSANLFSRAGIKIPKTITVKSSSFIPTKKIKSLGFPLVVKPSKSGSSMGVTIVHDKTNLEPAIKQAFRYDDVVLVQKCIAGDEVTCGVLEEPGSRRSFALPPTQIIPVNSKFFDYKAKYTAGASEEVTPARLPGKVIKKIQRNAVLAHEVLGCSGMSRTDMIVAKDGVHVLETNTIPGMTETSLLPQAAAAAGIPFPQLLDHLITSALKK